MGEKRLLGATLEVVGATLSYLEVLTREVLRLRSANEAGGGVAAPSLAAGATYDGMVRYPYASVYGHRM